MTNNQQNCAFFDSNIITIGENVWLGANVTVLPGVTIGDRLSLEQDLW